MLGTPVDATNSLISGGPASFTLIGAIGAYHFRADFWVRGQPVGASGPGTVFESGTIANLRNGQRVTVMRCGEAS